MVHSFQARLQYYHSMTFEKTLALAFATPLFPPSIRSCSPTICHRRPRAPVALNRSTPPQSDDEEDPDPVVSRRVFLAGIAVTTTVTAAGAYRFVIGEDIESRVRLKLSQRFPTLFPPEQSADERRRPLNASFAKAYYDSLATTAEKLRLIGISDLQREENALEKRALPLFFDEDKPITQSFSDPAWLNFLLYSRIRVISRLTSPASRTQFTEEVSKQTFQYFKTRSVSQTPQQARSDPNTWLQNINALLDELISLGWISTYVVEEFDGAEGSSWQDEGRSTLTIYAMDPVTIQAAQLIGEEEYEEISPKISGWIRALLVDRGIKVSMEDYYLDNKYRPDPEQYKPSQLATQFDISL